MWGGSVAGRSRGTLRVKISYVEGTSSNMVMGAEEYVKRVVLRMRGETENLKH